MSTFNFTLFGAKGIFANNAIVLNNYCRKVFKPLLGYFAILSLIFSTNQSFSQINILDEDISDWVTALNDASNPAKSFSHDANNTNDTQFTQGSQDPDFISEWGWELGNTNNKGDISNAGAVLIGNTLYFFGDRTAINGDAAIGFWFFQSRVTRNPDGTFNGSHTVGDILVLSNFTNGGGRVDLRVYEWVGSGGSDGTLNFLRETTNARVNSTTTVIPDNGPFDASRNGGLIGGDMWTYQGNNVPSEGTPAPNTYHIGAFFEGFVRLSELSDRCFTTFLLETRNSQSLNASLQDFVMDEFGGVPPAPGTSPLAYCVGDTAAQLSATGSNLLWYDSVEDTTGETTAPTPSTAVAGVQDYYVSQSNDNGCESERALLRVTIKAIPNAPSTTNDAICGPGTVNLGASGCTDGTLKWYNAEVNGTMVNTGTTYSPSLSETKDYYVSCTINGCEGPRTKVTGRVDTPVEAGTGGSARYCEDDTDLGNIDLYELITGEETGGVFTRNSDNGVVNNPINLSTAAPGTYMYTYTVTPVAPSVCPTDTATITIRIDNTVTAGEGRHVRYCEDDVALESIDLYDLVDDENNGGVFKNAADATVGPTIDLSEAAPGEYIYSYTVTPEAGSVCPPDSTEIKIKIDRAFEAGTGGSDAYCIGDPLLASVDLYALITGGDAGGRFTDADYNLISNPADLSLYPAGIYEFTYTVEAEIPTLAPGPAQIQDINACPADTTIVTITINALPGVEINPYAPVCLEDGIFLLTQGTPEGGSYSGTGVIDNGDGTYSFDPSVVGTGNSSTITYTYSDDNRCENSTTTDISVITCVVKCDTVYGYKYNSQCFIPKFSNWGWTTQITAAETSYTFNLYGGNGNDCDPTDGPGTLYGTATVTYTAGGKVTIFYSMIGSNILNEAHVYIGCNPYPKTKKGAETVAPGSYNFNPTLGGGVKTYTVEVNGVSGPIYIIVHGVACSSGIIAGADGGTKVYSASIACTTPTVAASTIKTQTKSSNVVVSPNPFVKEAKISYSFDYNTKVKIDVVDMTGNVIKSYNNISYKVGTKGETNLSLSNSLDKMLFVRVSTERETVVKQLVSFNGPEK